MSKRSAETRAANPARDVLILTFKEKKFMLRTRAMMIKQVLDHYCNI